MSVSLKRVMLISDDPALHAALRQALGLIAPAAVLGLGALAAPLDLIVLDARPPAEATSLIAALRQLPGCATAPVALIGPAGATGVIASLPMPDGPAGLAAELAALWQRYQARLIEEFISQLTDEYIAELPEIWAQMSSGWASLQRSWGATDRQQLQRLAHTIRGASASLGLHRLSAAARAIDVALGAGPGLAPLAEHLVGISALFEDLRLAIIALRDRA